MNATLKQIAQDALQLGAAERAELAEFLVASLDAPAPDEVQRLWIEEAEKRLAELSLGSVTPVPGETALAEARALARR